MPRRARDQPERPVGAQPAGDDRARRAAGCATRAHAGARRRRAPGRPDLVYNLALLCRDAGDARPPAREHAARARRIGAGTREVPAASLHGLHRLIRHAPSHHAPRNAFYAQSGGVTAVINASAAGVIETARKHKDRIGKVYAGRNGIIGALTEDLIDTSRESARAIAALQLHAGRRVRLVPLQAEGPRGEPRAVRAADRGVPRARHRLLLLQRRQRLRRHLPQGVADRGEAGLSADRDPRAEDRRQRPADHRQLPGLRLGREVRRDVDARGRRSTSRRWPRRRPRCSCSR